ncbi:hypothetical protein DMENIID0001_016120 [Sergentomyia squamirostris]
MSHLPRWKLPGKLPTTPGETRKPMTSAQEILDFIGLTLGKDNESGARCYKIRKRNQESVPASFKIGLSAPAYDAVSSVAFWPAGIFVKDFQFLGDRGPPLLNP